MAVKVPFIQVYRSKGKVYTYYRRDGHRIRIPGAVGSTVWMSEYQKVHESFESEKDGDQHQIRIGSIAHAISGYIESKKYSKLSDSSKKDYQLYLNILKTGYGHILISSIHPEHIGILRDKYADTPRKADYLVAVLRALLKFAKTKTLTYKLPTGWQNPAEGVEKLQEDTDQPGHRAWSNEEIKQFRRYWKPFTRERLAFELLLNSGQRGGDVIDMLVEHYNGHKIEVCQNKTGERLTVPATTRLKRMLEFWINNQPKATHLLLSEKGRPFKVDRFRHVMKNAYRAAGLEEDLTSHGLRHTAASILREVGCQWDEIGAITGHKTMEMVRRYVQQREKAERAIGHIEKAEKKKVSNRNKKSV